MKLSDAQLAVLKNLARGRQPYFGLRGRSAFGGLVKTITSLMRRGLIEISGDQYVLTASGKAEAAK